MGDAKGRKHGSSGIGLLLVVAVLHGGLYASLMPPWGLIDEAQHLHYVQYLAEGRGFPIADETPISPEIVASLFATKRWEKFHWMAPPAADPTQMGVEGYSYEAYHPPGFYLLMAPLFRAFPPPILTRLFLLRWVVVLLSVATVGLAYATARRLEPARPLFAWLAALLLIALPERTQAVSRFNNDALLEVVAAAALALAATICLQGLTLRRGLLLGLLLALGISVKLSMLFLLLPLAFMLWLQRRSPGFAAAVLGAAIPAAVAALTLAVRNWAIYGEPTGYSAFDALYAPSPPRLDAASVATAAIDLFRNYWLIWWEGHEAKHPPLLAVLDVLVLGVVAIAAAGLAQRGWRALRRGALTPRAQAYLVFALVVATYALATAGAYFRGAIPVPQGRFLLPASLAIVLLLASGLWSRRRGPWLLLALCALLFLFDGLALFGNLLPFHYYWSAVALDLVPPAASASDRIALFVQRLLADKPDWVVALALGVPLAYWVAVVAALVAGTRWVRAPSRT